MLTSRRLLWLFVSAVVVIGGAWWLSSSREAPGERATGDKVLPGLKERLDDVNEVRIVTAGDKTAVTLKKLEDNRWGVMERGGYAVDRSKLVRLLRGLADLEIVEEKTSTPAHYARLGVQDVNDEKTTGARIDLVGLDKPMSLIVGTSAGARGSYVRPPDQAQSLLAQPQLPVERDPARWVDTRLFEIPMDRVQEVRVELPKSRYTASREKPDTAEFSVNPIPKGRELSSPTAANSLAGALSYFNFDDVSALASTTIPEGEHARAEYRLFDGTVITFDGTKAGSDHWITISVAFDEAQHERFAAAAREAAAAKARESAEATTDHEPDPSAAAAESAARSSESAESASGTKAADEVTPASGESEAKTATPSVPDAEQVKKNAEALAKRFDGWLYKIPAYKYETLFQPIDDLLKAP